MLTGVRPGERLNEILFAKDEPMAETGLDATVETVTDGPVSVGTVWRGQMKGLGRAVDWTGEFTRVDAHTATEFSGEENKPVRDASVPVVAVQSKGRSLLRVDLAYGTKPGRFTLRKTAEDSEREAASIERRLGLMDKEINLPGINPERQKLLQQKREELVARYAEKSGRDTRGITFHYVLSLFKVSVIAQQIYSRFKQGLTKDERFAEMITGVQVLSRTAARAIETGTLRP